jgi:hypothetical protein
MRGWMYSKTLCFDLEDSIGTASKRRSWIYQFPFELSAIAGFYIAKSIHIYHQAV